MGYFRKLHTRILAYGKLLLSEHRCPEEVAFAIFLGCIVGCLPLTGVQIFICIALARFLSLNLPIMYGAANISLPPVVPFIAWASVQLGERVLHGRYLALHRSDFVGARLPELIKRFFVAWMVGGTLLGGTLGLIFGTAVYAILRQRARRALPADPIALAICRAAQRYAQTPRKFRYYARAKYRMDPCYTALLRRIPEGALVVDLGCGLGMLGVALAELGGGRRTWGVDWDAEKIAAGTRAANGLEVVLCKGDLRTAELPACDVVVLVDVLHYYDAATQTAILTRAAAALLPSGRLLLRETDAARRGGVRLTRFFERAMVRLGWNHGPKVYYRPIAELVQTLHGLGFTTEQLEVAGKTHPGNVLLCAVRPLAGRSAS